MGYVCRKKNIPSAKTYKEYLSNITFNYLREYSPNSLCHILNHQSFLTTQLHCIFLVSTSHTFYKCSTSKCKFSDFPMLALKFTKFFISFLEARVSFSSNFASHFCVMRHNFSVLFHLNLYLLRTKRVHQSVNFQSFDCLHEN